MGPAEPPRARKDLCFQSFMHVDTNQCANRTGRQQGDNCAYQGANRSGTGRADGEDRTSFFESVRRSDRKVLSTVGLLCHAKRKGRPCDPGVPPQDTHNLRRMLALSLRQEPCAYHGVVSPLVIAHMLVSPLVERWKSRESLVTRKASAARRAPAVLSSGRAWQAHGKLGERRFFLWLPAVDADQRWPRAEHGLSRPLASRHDADYQPHMRNTLFVRPISGGSDNSGRSCTIHTAVQRGPTPNSFVLATAPSRC